MVLEGALGVGAEVLERVFGGALGLLGAAGDALVVGVVGGRAGLGAGLALGLGGLAALVGGGHCCGLWLWRFEVGWVSGLDGVRCVGLIVVSSSRERYGLGVGELEDEGVVCL